MALDASSEYYILPFKPPADRRFHNLGKNASVTDRDSDNSTDLLEIRITEIPQDLDDSMMLQSRSISGNATNDFGSVMRHQDIDFESLNQILAKDVVFMSSTSSDDSKLSLEMDGPGMNIGSVPVIMFPKGLSEHEELVQSDEILSSELRYCSSLKAGKNVSDDYILYNDDGLSSVQVLGVESIDQSLWISEQCTELLPQVALETSNLGQSDLQGSRLVPVKLENDIVFIDAAPPSNSLMTGDKDMLPSLITNLVGADPLAQDRPSVISIAVPGAGSCDLNKGQKNSEMECRSQLLALNHQLAPVYQASGYEKPQTALNPQHVIPPTRSRSVLKASFAKGVTRQVPLKPKPSGKYVLKEEHFRSLINSGPKQVNRNIQLSKKTGTKPVKGTRSKPQSLAVVAISSDKTKDLTEIVVSTSKGDQLFKGKTSELISATPNLWRTNSPKTADETSQSSDSNALEDEEFLDDQPVTDALQRLGVPTLNWVQNKPEDQRLWYCPEKGCKKLFPFLNQLKVHILGHYGVRPYKCDFPNCQWAFYTHFKLKRHKETHLQRKDYKCLVPECGRSFTTIYNLKTHQKLHKRPAEIMCPVDNCSELFQTRRSLEFHLKEHGTDHAPYVCPYSSCQKRYYTVNSVNSHIRSHQHKDDEIRCQWSGCSKVFTKPCRLRAHMRTHTGDKPYLCTHPGCTWAFTSSSKLRRHQFKHTNVRNFQCRIDGCGKLFMRSEHLKEHALTHSAERTFHCPHPNCNMKFSAKSSLYVHSKKHRAKVHAVSSESLTDAITSIPVKVIQSPQKLGVQSVTNNICSIPELDDQIAIQTISAESSVQQEISEPAQTLDFIPLLSEDEALVAELANMEPVSFEHNVTVPSRSADTSFPSQVMDNSSNDMNTLSGYIDDSRTSNGMSQVLISTPGSAIHFPEVQRQDEDINQVLNPGSARSSITIHSWTKFKKVRQSQGLPGRHHRQPRRQSQQLQKYKKQIQDVQSTERDQAHINTIKQQPQEGITNLRAPLDVVLGASYLGSGHDSIAHLLLPDDLATSSDLYSTEDGILNMDSSFVPSTINLRDLE